MRPGAGETIALPEKLMFGVPDESIGKLEVCERLGLAPLAATVVPAIA